MQKNKQNHTIPPELLEGIEQLDRMRRDFVANVSHELRTPLTVIRGYLEILLHEIANQQHPWETIMQQMYQHSLRMESLIEDLLLLSRLESEEMDNEPSKVVDVNALLESLKHDAISLSGKQQHHILLNTTPELQLLGHESELKSLFSNIVFNAVKYTPEGGTIKIKWYVQNDQAIFAVSDTGIGIERKHIPRLAERFYRVDKARSRASGGTGLGLAIAKHVLIRHQAQLKVESTLGKGSTFECIFPTARTYMK